MIKAPISLQDLRRSLYVKAKAESSWRFWGLYVHVCKMETLWEAYRMARSNNGAPGIDGVTFEAIEESGPEGFLKRIRDELVSDTYRPMRVRKKEIPKDGGKVRVLSIHTNGIPSAVWQAQPRPGSPAAAPVEDSQGLPFRGSQSQATNSLQCTVYGTQYSLVNPQE